MRFKLTRYISRVSQFWYLESTIHEDGEIEKDMMQEIKDEDVKHRIKPEWLNFKSASKILYYCQMPLKLKEKFYRMTIRPTILYSSNYWAIKKQHEINGWGTNENGKIDEW